MPIFELGLRSMAGKSSPSVETRAWYRARDL